jgi:hypothetical protein
MPETVREERKEDGKELRDDWNEVFLLALTVDTVDLRQGVRSRFVDADLKMHQRAAGKSSIGNKALVLAMIFDWF